MIGEPMRTLSKILLLLAIGVGVPSFASPAEAASGVTTVQGRSRQRAHRRKAHHRERQRERRHEEHAQDHPGEL